MVPSTESGPRSSPSPVRVFLGVTEELNPFALLGLPTAPCDVAAVDAALTRRLARIDSHALWRTPEADEVRLALHTAAAQLRDVTVRLRLVDGLVAQSAARRRAACVSVFRVAALQAIASSGGWNTPAMRRVAALAHAQGVDIPTVRAALHGPSALVREVGFCASPAARFATVCTSDGGHPETPLLSPSSARTLRETPPWGAWVSLAALGCAMLAVCLVLFGVFDPSPRPVPVRVSGPSPPPDFAGSVGPDPPVGLVVSSQPSVLEPLFSPPAGIAPEPVPAFVPSFPVPRRRLDPFERWWLTQADRTIADTVLDAGASDAEALWAAARCARLSGVVAIWRASGESEGLRERVQSFRRGLNPAASPGPAPAVDDGVWTASYLGASLDGPSKLRALESLARRSGSGLFLGPIDACTLGSAALQSVNAVCRGVAQEVVLQRRHEPLVLDGLLRSLARSPATESQRTFLNGVLEGIASAGGSGGLPDHRSPSYGVARRSALVSALLERLAAEDPRTSLLTEAHAAFVSEVGVRSAGPRVLVAQRLAGLEALATLLSRERPSVSPSVGRELASHRRAAGRAPGIAQQLLAIERGRLGVWSAWCALPSLPSALPAVVQVAGVAEGWRTVLAASSASLSASVLAAETPSAWLRLAEDTAYDTADGVVSAPLARRFFAVSLASGIAAGDASVAASACIGLADLEPDAHRRLRCLAAARLYAPWWGVPVVSEGRRVSVGGVAAAEALGESRAGRYRRVAEAMQAPAAIAAIASLPAGVAGFAAEAAAVREECPGCGGQGVQWRDLGGGVRTPVLCRVCGGLPGGPMPRARLARFARAEAYLLGVKASTWAVQRLLDGGAPLPIADGPGVVGMYEPDLLGFYGLVPSE